MYVCVRERESESLNKSFHTLFLFAQTLAICLTLLQSRRVTLAISASVWLYACVSTPVHVSVFGWRALMSNISSRKPWDNFMWFDLRGAGESRLPRAISPILTSSAFRLCLGPDFKKKMFSYLFSGWRGRGGLKISKPLVKSLIY